MALIGVLLIMLTACAKRNKGYVEDSDPEMAAAIAKTQEALPQFWQVFDQRAGGESNFVLVVRITNKGRMEHFHTTDFERRNGKTMVTIKNDPKIVSSVKSATGLRFQRWTSRTGPTCATGSMPACLRRRLYLRSCRQSKLKPSKKFLIDP